MGVQITILSGSKQGRQIELFGDEFRAGGDISCDVFFDPKSDATADGRAALLQKTDEGWCIRNVGRGELLLNQQAVSGRTRIRSGDIIRLSDRGPDFSFALTTPQKASMAEAIAQNDVGTAAQREASQKPRALPTREPAPKPLGTEDVLQNGVASESTLAPLPSAALPPVARKWTVLLVAAIVAGIFLVAGAISLGLLSQGGSDGTPDEFIVSTQQSVDIIDDVKPKNAEPVAPQVENTNQIDDVQAGEPKEIDSEAKPPSASDDIIASTGSSSEKALQSADKNIEKTVWLLQVRDAGGRFVYPFATSVAVDNRLLLTTASVAEELNKFRAKGWKIFAYNAGSQETVDIGKIRVHGVYADLAGKREEQIYVDLAVLESKQDLGEVAKPASEAQLAELDTGTQLLCVGIPHQGDAIKTQDSKRLDSLLPKKFSGKVFLRTKLDPNSIVGPRLLHFKSQLGDNVYGSPIVNEKGELVAVYAESSAGGEGQRLGMHYAPMLNPALIRMAIEGQYGQFWVLLQSHLNKP